MKHTKYPDLSRKIPSGFVAITEDVDQASGLPRRILCKKDNSEMVLVPAGEFLMGSGKSHEDPEHKIFLDAYYMDVCPVTFNQYDTFCEATGREKPSDEDWGRGRHPVIWVTWDDATAYCRWADKRLPTEAEWEKAARGTDGRKFPWGEKRREIPEILDHMFPNYSGSDPREIGTRTKPVGSWPHEISPYGCLDMVGNVREWCSDKYHLDYYKNSPKTNPQGPEKGYGRVSRGGYWGDQIHPSTCYARYPSKPESTCHTGFRCVLIP